MVNELCGQDPAAHTNRSVNLLAVVADISLAELTGDGSNLRAEPAPARGGTKSRQNPGANLHREETEKANGNQHYGIIRGQDARPLVPLVAQTQDSGS